MHTDKYEEVRCFLNKENTAFTIESNNFLEGHSDYWTIELKGCRTIWPWDYWAFRISAFGSDYSFFPPPKSEYFFQQHWESEYFFGKEP